jgi:hypothetical protein
MSFYYELGSDKEPINIVEFDNGYPLIIAPFKSYIPCFAVIFRIP